MVSGQYPTVATTAATPAVGAPAGTAGTAPDLTGSAYGGPAWVTPDAVALDVEVATIGSRGIAYLLDLSLVLSALFLVQLGQLLLGWDPAGMGWLGVAVLLLAAFALQFGYPIGFEVLWRGRTLGKAALGLRVITVEGAPVGFRHATIRAVAAVFELLSTLGMFAVIASFASHRGQRLGDLAAGTVVIRERRARRPVAGLRYTVPPGWGAYVERLDVGELGSADLAVIRDTLRRADSLPPDVRGQLLHSVAGSLVRRVTPPPPPHVGAETWLRCVAARLAARGGLTQR